MTKDDLERLNHELRELFPVLRERLRQAHGETLDKWLAVGRSRAVTVVATDEPYYAPFTSDDTLQESASELFYLNIPGYDGFHPSSPLVAADCEWIREQVRAMTQQRMRDNGLLQLINEIRSGHYDDEPMSKEAAVFFVWAAIIEDEQPSEVGDLWILEQSPDFHDYMFLLDDGTRLCQSWRVCADRLSPEILAALDQEYIDLENAA